MISSVTQASVKVTQSLFEFSGEDVMAHCLHQPAHLTLHFVITR